MLFKFLSTTLSPMRTKKNSNMGGRYQEPRKRIWKVGRWVWDWVEWWLWLFYNAVYSAVVTYHGTICAKWLCEQWNGGEGGSRESTTISFMKQSQPLGGLDDWCVVQTDVLVRWSVGVGVLEIQRLIDELSPLVCFGENKERKKLTWIFFSSILQKQSASKISEEIRKKYYHALCRHVGVA
jgi:hypothetical protein